MINDSIVNYKLYIINLIMINSEFDKKYHKVGEQTSTPLDRGHDNHIFRTSQVHEFYYSMI